LLSFANAQLVQYVESENDATIVMQCRIEKKNYASWSGFTITAAISGWDLSFPLDSIAL
jgi:hypothetical protein